MLNIKREKNGPESKILVSLHALMGATAHELEEEIYPSIEM